MSCDVRRNEDGTSLIVCGRSQAPRPQRCHYCKAPSDRLCDFVVRHRAEGICLVPETCSRPVCAERCSASPAPGVDHCKHHAEIGQAEAKP